MSLEPAAVNGTIAIRRGEPDDTRACHQLLWEAATDLGVRHGTPLEGSADDWWPASGPIHRYLAEHAAEWWVAEEPGSPPLVGYARSIERNGLFELTEFFVRPGQQSRGLGRELLERAFPIGRGEVRAIIATTDVRALARYYAADTVARFPILTLEGPPASVEPPRRLTAVSIGSGDAESLAAADEIERAVLGYGRGAVELGWLAEQREGYLYRRGGETVGVAFVSNAAAGPIAALDPTDLPEMLLHLEGQAAAVGLKKLELEVPAPNAVAIRHLLGRGFRINQWVNLLMSSRPFGQFDRFIGFSPPMFL